MSAIRVEIRYLTGAACWTCTSLDPPIDVPGFDASDALEQFKIKARALYGEDVEVEVTHMDTARTGPAAGMR